MRPLIIPGSGLKCGVGFNWPTSVHLLRIPSYPSPITGSFRKAELRTLREGPEVSGFPCKWPWRRLPEPDLPSLRLPDPVHPPPVH